MADKKNSKVKKYFYIISSWLAIASFILSCITIYRQFYKPADLDIFVSERIAFTKSRDFPLRIFITCNISNEGAKTGVVHKLGLILLDPARENSGQLLDWNVFVFANEFVNDRLVWDIESRAIPLIIGQHSSISKTIEFQGNNSTINTNLEPRTYTFKLLCWSEKGYKPNIINEFKITFDQDFC